MMTTGILMLLNLSPFVWAYFVAVKKIRKEIDLCKKECEYCYSSTNEIMIDYSNKLSDLQKEIKELKESCYKTGKQLGRPLGSKNKQK